MCIRDSNHVTDASLKDYFKNNYNVFNEDQLSLLLNDQVQTNAFDIFHRKFHQNKNQDAMNQLLLAECALLLPGNNLVKPDRMGMAHSVELRAPFLDYRFVEHSFKLPGSLKVSKDKTKILLRKMAVSYTHLTLPTIYSV